MPTGNYGIVRPADVGVNDVEMFYTFTTDRTVIPTAPVKLNPSEILSKIDHPNEVNRIIGGLYNLRLPTNIFNKKGFYALYIRPKEINATIVDCGVLSVRPDIRGILFNLDNVSAEDVYRFENNNLVGYRIEYLNVNANNQEKKIQNLFRIITSNFKVEPVSESLTNTTQKSIKYRLNDNSTLVFCTLTPSSPFTLKPNVVPFIGVPNQKVIITNTFFDPIMVDLELSEHNFDTLAIGIFGNQTKNIQNGTHTYYNENNEIYKQFNEYVIKEEFTNTSLYEVKEEKSDIDFTQQFDSIIK